MSNAENKLKKISVVMKFTTTTGYGADIAFRSTTEHTPEQALTGAIDELSRVASLSGVDPVKIAQAAAERVKNWQAQQSEVAS